MSDRGHKLQLAIRRNEPMRLYLKGVKGELLKAAEELALGREMEEATRAALDALARWPSGLASLVETAKRVQSGEANVMDFSSRTEPEPVREDHAELTPEGAWCRGKHHAYPRQTMKATTIVRDQNAYGKTYRTAKFEAQKKPK